MYHCIPPVYFAYMCVFVAKGPLGPSLAHGLKALLCAIRKRRQYWLEACLQIIPNGTEASS